MISLKARQTLEERTDDVIDRAQKLIDSTEVQRGEMRSTQLKNLLEMSSSTDSVKALEVFIRYQMGRRTTQRAWTFNNFGERLLSEFSWLLDLAKQIAKDTGDDPKRVHLDLIRLYLGYAHRYFVYKESLQETSRRE